MKLKDLERDIQRMEESVHRMASINQEMMQLDHQVDNVRCDLINELHVMERNAQQKLARRTSTC